MLPFEFVVPGIPVSQQARRKERLRAWKTFVRTHAGARWPRHDSPLNVPLKITLVYYYDSVALDTDNILKPIQDALIGLVYTDDRQVTDISVRSTNISGSFRVRGMSPILAEGFCSKKEFLYVRIDPAPDHEELL